MHRVAPWVLALLPASLCFAEEPPAAGKADTSALDTYLRRNEHPPTVKLIEHSGAGGSDVPVTFGMGCGEGDFPAGRLCPVADGAALPAQVDVLATWPRDGSIRHALVSLVIPRIGPGETLSLSFRRAAPTAARFRAAVSPEGLVVRAEFEAEDGKETVSQVPADVVTRIARILEGAAEPGELAPRLAGPICYEFEIHDRAKTDGQEDPDIDVLYRLRFYSGFPGIRIAYVVENTHVPAPPYPAEFAIADRDFVGLRFQAGPPGALETIYAHGPATHWYGTRYRVLGWVGGQPPALYAKQSLPYLMYAEFFPKLDIENPVVGAEADKAVRTFEARGYDPAEAPLGRILHHNHVHRHMPGTGGRPDIGAYATWHRLALASDSPRLHELALAADGNSLGSFPIHRREVGSHAPGAPYAAAIHPMFWYSLERGSDRSVTYAKSETACPQIPDYAHTPSAAYYSYLTTGDRFFEEELAFWGMYPSYLWPFKGMLPGPTRAMAWQLRNVTDAAFLLPDRHVRKQYLSDYVDRNLEMLAGVLARDGHLFMDRQRKCSGRKFFVCSNQVSTWMYGWLLWALDNAARKGWSAAGAIRDGAADILLRLYEGTEEFTAPNGKVYRWDPSYAMAYQVAVDLLQVEFLDNGQEKDTFIRDITGNTGEMYYYTLVNDCHKYWFADKADYEAWKATLPRKVMGPDDWPLDEDLARRNRSQLPHEYGNAECSAALARYDNPRAWHMYDFVRGTMADTPDRIRGIEYVR